MKKGILFFILSSFLFNGCNSFLSIEKRKYRNGYHIEWVSKRQNDLPQSARRIQRESQRNSDSAFSAIISAPSAVNSPYEKNILIEKPKPKIVQLVFRNDTLLKKKNKNEPLSKFDERKDVTKKENGYQLSKLGFYFGISCAILLLAIISLHLYFLNFLLLPSIVISIVGLIFSGIGLDKINKGSDKSGKGFALAGILINSLYLLFWFALLIISILLALQFIAEGGIHIGRII